MIEDMGLVPGVDARPLVMDFPDNLVVPAFHPDIHPAVGGGVFLMAFQQIGNRPADLQPGGFHDTEDGRRKNGGARAVEVVNTPHLLL